MNMEKDSTKELFNIGKSGFAGCLILTLLRTISVYFYNINDLPSTQVKVFLLLAFHFLLAFIVLYSVFVVTKYFLDNINFRSDADKKSGNVFLPSFIILLILWLPYLIIKYPGALNWDSWAMFDEHLSGTISNYQSVTYAYLFGWLFEVFARLGNVNLSLFVLAGTHYILYAAVFAYSFVVLRKLRVPKWYLYVTWGIYAFNPLITGYIGVAIKDCVYAVFLFASFLILVEMYIEKTDRFPVKKLVILALSIILACLVRKNGIYVYAGVVLAMFLSSLSKKKPTLKVRANARIAVSAGLILYLVIYMLIQTVVRPVPDNTTEMYSLPFQQTARYVRDHGDELTPEQIKIIDDVLEYDTLAQRYDPMISDPVKERSNGSITVTGPYFKLWFNLFFKHPLTYFGATGEQNYYLLSPEAEVNDVTYFINAHEFYQHATYYPIPAYDYLFAAPQTRIGLQYSLFNYNRTVQFIPFLNVFWNGSYAFYILAVITSFFISRKKDAGILAIFWMTIVFVLVGPVIYGHPRYLFPIIYSLPVLFAYFYNVCRKESDIT